MMCFTLLRGGKSKYAGDSIRKYKTQMHRRNLYVCFVVLIARRVNTKASCIVFPIISAIIAISLLSSSTFF